MNWNRPSFMQTSIQCLMNFGSILKRLWETIMRVSSVNRPIFNMRFNRPLMQRKCPLCNLTTGVLIPQNQALRELGIYGGTHAHLVCVQDAREQRQ